MWSPPLVQALPVQSPKAESWARSIRGVDVPWACSSVDAAQENT